MAPSRADEMAAASPGAALPEAMCEVDAAIAPQTAWRATLFVFAVASLALVSSRALLVLLPHPYEAAGFLRARRLDDVADFFFGDDRPGTSQTSGAASNMDTSDGNVCQDDEELFNGLCYKTCRLLTGGSSPVRTSPWTCCGDPCNPSSLKHNVGMCSGFDIAGGDGKSCPHDPGACYADEELHIGQCYKKCSALTQGKFPYRIAGATCCRAKGYGCFKPWNLKTKPNYSTGGSQSCANGAMCGPHAPVKSLTEAS